MNAATISGAIQAAAGASTREKAETHCSHCGLPVSAGLIQAGSREQFCCAGCRTVFDVIRGSGLEHFYRVRAASDWKQQNARVTGQRYSEYDDAAFLSAYCRPCGDSTQSADLLLENVHCGACVWLVEKLPRILPGVLDARLSLRRASARIIWDPQKVQLSQIARTLDSLGYPPHPVRGISTAELRKLEDRRFMIRLAIAGAAAGNAMLLAFALYAGAFSGMEAGYSTLLRWASALIGVISVAWPGSIFFRGALAALRMRTMHIDVPIALGLGVGAMSGIINTALGIGEIYFDSLTMLVFLLLVARFVQSRQQRQATDSVELLFSLTPTRARRISSNKVEEVAIESLQPGDIVLVHAQESIPVDGTVLSAAAQIDQALLTGESRPVHLAVGAPIHAGSISLSANLRIRVEKTGQETRVGRLMALVEDSLRHKSPIVQLMDRIAGRFVAAVLVLAAATLAFWLWRAPARAADHTIALLIVACPCALGLATPLAIAAAIGRAARRGILIKGGAALEQLAQPGLMLLDKTGTVTCGQMSLVRWHGPREIQPLVAALESRVAHPIARALTDALKSDCPMPVEHVATEPGGVSGVVAGQGIAIGSAEFSAARCPQPAAWMTDFTSAATRDALTPVFVSVDGQILAAAALGDDIRPDSNASLDMLRSKGWNIGLLSGDHAEVVASVADRLRIPPAAQVGGATPEEKLRAVQNNLQNGPIVMIGDGVNDAAALAAATVGIAVHGGAEASFAAADVYLNRPGLTPVVELTVAARQTMKAIRRCLLVSVGYNLAGVSLAVTGLITPLIAALLMPLSSITVVSIALAARTFGGGRTCR